MGDGCFLDGFMYFYVLPNKFEGIHEIQSVRGERFRNESILTSLCADSRVASTTPVKSCFGLGILRSFDTLCLSPWGPAC